MKGDDILAIKQEDENKSSLRVIFYISLMTTVIFLMLEEINALTEDNLIIYNHIPLLNNYPIRILSLSASISFSLSYIVALAIINIVQLNGIKRETYLLFLSFLLTMFFVYVFKVTFRIPRPNGEQLHYPLGKALTNPDIFSFPSGHTARASVLAWYFGKKHQNFVKALLWLWVLGVAFSRLALHAHWLSDVITSVVLGICVSSFIDLTADVWIDLYSKLIGKLGFLRIR